MLNVPEWNEQVMKRYKRLQERMLIAISTSGDGNEVGVSFDRSSLCLKFHFQMATVRQQPLKLFAERRQAFLKSLYLYYFYAQCPRMKWTSNKEVQKTTGEDILTYHVCLDAGYGAIHEQGLSS